MKNAGKETKTNATWLLVSLDDDNIAFGLCDLGLGFPELGYVSLEELSSVRGQFGLPIERDRSFSADKTLDGYVDEAYLNARIIA